MDIPHIDNGATQDRRLLDAICQIDQEYPCAGSYFRAGHFRRQVIAAALSPYILARGPNRGLALASLGASEPGSSNAVLLASAGKAISHERSAEIIRRSYGPIPRGFLGAIGRCGSEARTSKFYANLYGVFSVPEHRHIARLLAHVPVIDTSMLRAALALPTYLCKPAVVAALAHSNVEDFLAAVALIREVCPAATPEALGASLPHQGTMSIAHWIARWTARMPLPKPPFAGDDLLRPMTTIAEMATIAREMRNCLHSKTVVALAGRAAYFVVRFDDAQYVVELVKSADKWETSGVFAYRNRVVPTDVSEAVADRLKTRGILPERSGYDDKDRWDPIRRALRQASLVDDERFDLGWME